MSSPRGSKIVSELEVYSICEIVLFCGIIMTQDIKTNLMEMKEDGIETNIQMINNINFVNLGKKSCSFNPYMK